MNIDVSGLIDPFVTEDHVAAALAATAAPFPDAEVQDTLDHDVTGFMKAPVVAASKPQRIGNARALRDNHTWVGVGMCLATVRGPILRLPAVYPTAAVAGDNSSPFHPIKDPNSTKVPRASIGFAWNGRAGHVWLELGPVKVDGKTLPLVSTTDYQESGYEGIAVRGPMLSWCGATRWGWGESVNTFDVWPDPRKPAPDKDWTWQDRLDLLEADLKRMKKNKASAADIAGVKAWIDRIKARHS